MKNFLFSLILHAVLFAYFYYDRLEPRRFEGYPVTIPVELVELKPVSYEAPEVQRVQPRVQEPKPQPRKVEGVTLEKPNPVKEEPEEPEPVKPEPEPEVEKGKSAVAGKNVRLDVDEFPYSYYLALLQSRIQANWEPPFQANRAGSRKVLVHFKIQRDGRITDLGVEQSSGDYLFDQAGLRAVTLANPLPPLPFDFPQQELGVHFEFEQGI